VTEPGRPISQQPDDDDLEARERIPTNEENAFDRENEHDTRATTAERDPALPQAGGIDPNTRGADHTRRRRWPRRPGIAPARPESELIRDKTETTRAPGLEP
jgi:hypothetical protein